MRICANCSTPNSLQDQFCSNCGYVLSGGPPDATIVPSTQVQTISVPGNQGSHRVTGALNAGMLLDGRYRITALVGKGGFGAVYKATDTRFPSQPVVAVKEMSDASLSATEKARAINDFKNEADLLVKLDHDNLPDVSNVFDDGGKVYLVMEFVEGETLEKVQEDRNAPLDEAMVMGWALQLCVVLHYLHTRIPPIIFRDMKPANVMVTVDGKIKLIDFGIARVFKTAASKDTTLLGSHGYAPLEQYGRGQSDARTDIYALGATLYHLLTNEVPADSPSRRVHPSIFVPPRQIHPGLSQATEAILLRAMADEPRDRYQSVAEMYQAIASTGIATVSNALFPISSSGLTGSYPGLQPNTPPTLISQHGIASAGTSIAPPPVGPSTGPASPTGGGGGLSRRALFWLGGGALGISAVGAGIYFLTRPTPTEPPVLGNSLEIPFIYSTEKETWLKEAIQIFNERKLTVGNQPVVVTATAEGSVRTKDNILAGNVLPVIWSPASDLELNQLIYAWQAEHSEEVVITSGELATASLVQSPIVFAIWRERAELLKVHYQKESIDWSDIADAVKKNSWQELGGQGNWGPVKLGHTRPDQSNSGLLTITLMAYAHYDKARDLSVTDVNAQDFLTYLDTFEQAVQKFGRSSGTFFSNEVIGGGPANYDIIMSYENLVLTLHDEAESRQGQPLLPFYPQRNIVSNHPFAILRGENITEEQQEAAKLFRDFLLSEEIQQRAVQQGFRPGSSTLGIDVDVPDNPFKFQFPGASIPTSLSNLAQGPDGDVVEALLQQWLSKYNLAPTALSQIPGQGGLA